MAQRTLQLSSQRLCQGIRRLFCPLRLQGTLLKYQRHYSNETFRNRILSLSSILLQDGLDVTELPIFIRKMDLSKFPFEDEKILTQVKPMTKEEELFKEKLQQCSNLKEVFRLLEVPSDVVTGYTAAFALQKICYLQEKDVVGDGIDSFIQTAVMNELYEIVKKELTSLSNNTLFFLIKCILTSDSSNIDSTQFLFEEIEKRIGDSEFIISEICELSCIAALHSQQFLIDTCWIHIGNRYEEIDASNIHLVFRCIPTSQKSLLKLIVKRFFLCWWKLKGSDISSIVLDMLRLRINDVRVLQHVGKWTFLNMHNVTDAHLTQIVAGFLHFHYTDTNLIKSLEQYIPAKIDKVDYNLLALVMEYCRAQRYLSTRIFDVVAGDIIKNGQNYTCLQIYSVLRPFGQLNYQPTRSMEFFLKTEEVIQSKISDFPLQNLVELLCSFAFLQRFPLNFSHLILTPSFLSKINGIANEKVQTMVGEWLEMLQSALLLETKHRNIPLLFKLPIASKVNPNSVLHREVLKGLSYIIGVDKVNINKTAVKSIYTIDFEISLDAEHSPLPVDNLPMDVHNRVALVLHQPEHFCVNTNHLLGQPAMKVRHLKLLGYKVIEVHCSMLRYTKAQRLKYLQALLQKHINRGSFSS